MKNKHPAVDHAATRPASRCALIPKARGRPHPDPVDGLRPVRLGGRQGLPVDLQSAGHLLGRHVDRHHAISAARKAASTSSRARRSASSIFDGGYGQEPIPLLEDFAKEYGFDVKQYPVPASADAEPVEPLAQRAPRPSGLHDHVGLGRDEPDRGQGSRQDRLSRWITSSACGGRAARTTRVRRRPAAKGYCRSTSTPSAPNSRRSRTSRSTSIGQGQEPDDAKDKVGENFYNRGVMNAVVIAEAIRNAQKLTGKKDITGEEMRRGLETLQHHGGALEGARASPASPRRST